MAIACRYAVSVNVLIIARSRRGWLNISRQAATFGCLLLIAHIASAFTIIIIGVIRQPGWKRRDKPKR
jgi:hypothetical protein